MLDWSRKTQTHAEIIDLIGKVNRKPIETIRKCDKKFTKYENTSNSEKSKIGT